VIEAVHQRIAGRKRFYKEVTVHPTSPISNQFCIKLDGRILRTPARNDLHLPSLELTMAIAAEWDAQTDGLTGIQPATMPLMTLASTAIDQVSENPHTTHHTCLSYLPTDTVLFHAHPTERELIKLQRMHFQPLLRWLRRRFGVELRTSDALMGRIAHPAESSRRVSLMLDQLDAFTLTCVQCWTMECKSLVLALALLSGEVSVAQAREAARLEEESQAEVWGVVEGGHDMDRLNLAVGLSSAHTFMDLLWAADERERLLSRWESVVAEDRPTK